MNPKKSKKKPGLALRLVQARKSTGLTVADVSKKSGVGISALESYEAGRHEPSATACAALAAAYGVTVEWLVWGGEDAVV